jgi:hypothetical protein
MKRELLIAILATGLVASVSWAAGESVTEHESYEKRSMKVETIPPAPRVDERTYEETTRTESQRRPAEAEAEVEVERKTTVEPGKVIREKKTETIEEEDD